MNNDELKKTIVEILFPVLKRSRVACNEENACERCWFPCEVDRLAGSLADALIAAGIGDVKDLKAQAGALEMTNIALQAGYDGAEEDRLYWVDKYKEAEHRAEVAEKALNSACFILAKNYYTDGKEDWAKRGAECATFYREQAERELAEEREDEQS